MRALAAIVIAHVVLASTGSAQQDVSHRLRPITAPVRHAGVFHVATGTWTRGASLANVAGPDVIYSNTCSAFYWTGMVTTEQFQHRSRIPSRSGPTTDSAYYGTTDPAHRWDARPGCRDEYLVNGFEFAYCSSHVGPWEMTHHFMSSWISTDGSNCGPSAPVYDTTLVLTGLPGGTASGGQQCWTVDIDLTGNEMALSADGDGTFAGPMTAEQFGWGFGPTSVTLTPADSTGPIIAGNFTWTGGPGTRSGLLTPCTGTDGTIWDDSVVPGEAGTGMGSNDFFRSPNPGYNDCFGNPTCCWYFGGNPHADFFLKLYADAQCPPDPSTPFCFPDVAGVRSCPCGNPPSGPDVGCDSFTGVASVSGAGGARLGASGVPSASLSNSLVFHVVKAHNPAGNSNLHIFWKGTSTLATGVKSGFGVRCVAGTLKRIYQGTGSGTGGLGSTNAVDFPNGVQTTDAWTASQTPAAGTTLYYYDSFRDQQGPANCNTANDRFNVSHAVAITWVP